MQDDKKKKLPPLKGNKSYKGFLFYIVALLVILSMAWFFQRGGDTKPQEYSALIKSIQAGEVENAVLEGTKLTLTYKSEDANKLPKVVKKTVSPYWMEGLQDTLQKASEQGTLKYDYVEPVNYGAWANVLMLTLLFGSVIFFFFMYFRQNEGKNPLTFTKSPARLHDPSEQNVSFDDVAGADEEKAELVEVVDYLKDSEKYHRLGAKVPKGILLVGPPGTGKTLLAKAVAGEANVPFFSIAGSNFVEMFVGAGASRVRDLFDQAKKNAPCIIFIDEIDAVGRQRGSGMGGSHDEREQTLNQLLVEMDGFGPNQGVIIIAATNRSDILDPALLRPGRFDRRIVVGIPDLKGREAVLQVHAKNKPFDPHIDFAEIARITSGLTGADLANLLNEAALSAARRNSEIIEYSDVMESLFRVMVGTEKKKRVINKKERRLTAWHEAGHAIILRTVSETDRVERVSIIPAGGAGGYTAHKPHEDLFYRSKKGLMAEIMIALGGRGAEEVAFGEVSTGASSDLQHVNSIAKSMVMKYGMSDRLPNLVFGGQGEVFIGRDYGHVKDYSDEVAAIIDQEILKIVDEAYSEVLRILNVKRRVLDALSERLLEKEKIEGPEFEALYQEYTTEEERAMDAENTGLKEIFFEDLAKKKSLANESDSVSESQELKDSSQEEVVEATEVESTENDLDTVVSNTQQEI